MLRITVLNHPDSVTFQLEGRLAGPWVQELERCWRDTVGSRPKPSPRFDLTGVTYIDAAGKTFLAARHAERAKFLASGCLMRAIVAEISSVRGRKPSNPPKKEPT
jgi:hypothetical protein